MGTNAQYSYFRLGVGQLATLILLVCAANPCTSQDASFQLAGYSDCCDAGGCDFDACDSHCDGCSTDCDSLGDCCTTSVCNRRKLVPNMIGDAGLGVPRLFGTAPQVIHFPDHFSKVTQNNSPLPRSRFYFDYTHIHAMQAISTTGGADDQSYDADLFRFGLERAFLDDLVSVELLLPFYDTTGSEVDDANFFNTGDTEFGNLAFGIKSLLINSDHLALSAGLRIEAPTREDQEGITANVEIERDTWFFQPYLGMLINHCDCFVQGFAGVRLRDSQDSGFVNDVRINNLNFITRDVFFADIGIGKTYSSSRSGLLRCLTPTIELHYLQAIEGGDPLLITQEFYGSHVDRLNITAGITAMLKSGSTISIAGVAPLRENAIVTAGSIPDLRLNTDRESQFQLAIQYNRFFGG